VVDSIRWWFSLRRNANFWDWVRSTYSERDLRRLVCESTDASLIRSYDPLGDQTIGQYVAAESLLKLTAQRLIRRYGDEIWGACLGAGGHDPGRGLTGLMCLASLPLAKQVHNHATLEEFLVRNALRHAAGQILDTRARSS